MFANLFSAPKKVACAAAVAAAFAVVPAQAALLDLTAASGTTTDQTAPALSTNLAVLSASATVSYNVTGLTQFDWFFQANDYLPYDDFGFVNFGAGNITLASVGSVGGYGNSGWQTYVLGSAFTGTVTFGSVNSRDSLGDSTLSIRNATLASAPIPEPASLALLGLGIVGLGLQRRRRLDA